MSHMAVPIDDELAKDLERYPWIVSSELAKEEMTKKEIFERYLKTKEITDKDWEFCEKIDWHPVDELPLKAESLERFKKARKGKTIKFLSVADIFR